MPTFNFKLTVRLNTILNILIYHCYIIVYCITKYIYTIIHDNIKNKNVPRFLNESVYLIPASNLYKIIKSTNLFVSRSIYVTRLIISRYKRNNKFYFEIASHCSTGRLTNGDIPSRNRVLAASRNIFSALTTRKTDFYYAWRNTNEKTCIFLYGILSRVTRKIETPSSIR